MAEPADVNAEPAGSRPALLILHVGPPEPADAATTIHRTVQPCRALGELPDVAVISGSLLSPELYRPVEGTGGRDLLSAADVLIIRDVGDPDLLPIVAARRREGRLTVFEPGARLLPPPGAAPLADLAGRSVAPQLARLADGVQVAGPGLDGQLDALNPRRACLPSQLWEAPPAPAPRAGPVVVLGWIGGAADRDDLASAVPALAGVLERHPEARLAFLAGPEVADLVSGLPAERVALKPPGSRADTQRFIEQLDVGVVPLGPRRGHLVSDLRALEYAARGVLPVCADADPFRELVRPGQTGWLFRDAGELETVLERTLADPALRATMAARAAGAAAERLERPHAADRLGFYLSLAAQRGIRWPPRGGQPASAWLAAAGPALRFAGSRYAALGSGEVERLLVEGCRMRAAGDASGAARAFAEAERLAPDAHLPPLLLGGVLSDPAIAVDVLARAEARRPASCRAPYERALRELARGNRDAAAAALEKARAAAPAFGAAQERLGQLAEAAGHSDQAARLYEEAALQNPSFPLPVARLALMARRRGETSRAVALLERALAADPELPLTHLVLGRVYLEAGRLHQARAHLERATAGHAAGWLAPLPAGFADVGEAAEAMEALTRAENRG